jgi:hypothetical protein
MKAIVACLLMVLGSRSIASANEGTCPMDNGSSIAVTEFAENAVKSHWRQMAVQQIKTVRSGLAGTGTDISDVYHPRRGYYTVAVTRYTVQVVGETVQGQTYGAHAVVRLSSEKGKCEVAGVSSALVTSNGAHLDSGPDHALLQ